MSFDGMGILDLAQELAGKKAGVSTEEARLRSAISRAYYAAFLTARKFLRNKRGARVPISPTAHQDVKDALLNDPDPQYQNTGAKLEILHTLRKQADYGDAFTGLPSLTTSALRIAQEIISALAQPKKPRGG